MLATYSNAKVPGPVAADHPGPAPDGKLGSCFRWKVVK